MAQFFLLSWARARPLLTPSPDAREAPLSAPSSPVRIIGSYADRTWFLPVLAILFFLSGISGLIYQTLWLRLLSLVFGVTIYAASTVLASFMGGLALGTVLAGRLTTRVRSPLAWLGAVELGIGAAALATPVALDFVSTLWLALHAWMPDQTWVLTLARVIFASAVLLVPTMLMGATLPLVVRSSLARGSLVGPRVGILYASNTAGAIAGALLAGFVLIGSIGIGRSFQVAAALNTFVGLSALLLALRRRSSEARAAVSAAAPADGTDTMVRARLVPAVFAVSGFAALALEIVWFRVLVLIFAASTYAFTTMLAAVLAGIALGSAAAAPLLLRSWHWTRVFGWTQIGTGLLAIGAMAVYLTGYHDGWLRGADYVASLVVILPPALCMGFAFAVGVRAETAFESSEAHSAARVARLYALNVAGAIVGSLVAGFVLIPSAGTRVSLVLLAACFVAAGLTVVWRHMDRSWRRPAVTVAVLAGFGSLAAVVPSPFNAVQGRRVPLGERPVFLEEGRQTTIGVYTQPAGGTILYLNGIHQADDSPPMVALHWRIGLLPVAIHPAPTSALIVGLGGGATPGAISLGDGLTLDIVELSDSVVRGAALFAHVNANVLERPNVRLRVDDGRNFLLTTSRRYDIVTADVIQPFLAGAGILYSREYFQLARRALAPGGVMLQWIGIRPATQYKLIARTFLDVFPHATVWAGGTLLVGTTEPLRLDPLAFDRKLAREGTRRALEMVDLHTFDRLLALYTAGPEQLRSFVGPGLLLTDDRPLVEFHRSLPGAGPEIDTSGLRDDVRRWVTGTR